MNLRGHQIDNINWQWELRKETCDFLLIEVHDPVHHPRRVKFLFDREGPFTQLELRKGQEDRHKYSLCTVASLLAMIKPQEPQNLKRRCGNGHEELWESLASCTQLVNWRYPGIIDVQRRMRMTKIHPGTGKTP